MPVPGAYSARRASRNPTPAQEISIATDISRQDRLPARGLRVSRQTPQANPARTRKRAAAREKKIHRRTPKPAKNEVPLRSAATLDAELEAQRALLADPATIAGGAARRPAARSRNALGPALSTKIDSVRMPEPAKTPGWQRRPLAPKTAPATTVPLATNTSAIAAVSPAAARPSLPIPLPAAERALAAEVREAKATLAIARETTQLQREEIGRLRADLAAVQAAQATATLQTRAVQARAEDPSEQASLRSRIVALEAELERASLELVELHRTLASQQQERIERSRSQASLQERFDVQEQALDHTRRQAEQERRRHTDAQTLLERLRATLRGVDNEPPDPDKALYPPPATASATAISAPLTATATEVPADNARSATAPIFEFWLEEQVRRNFGPIGVDSTADLLREPLARRARSTGAPLKLLLIGRGVGARARGLAEELVRFGSPDFVLHFADPSDATTSAGRGDDPLRAVLQRCEYPDRPEMLRRLVRDLTPAAIVGRDFLTWQPNLDAWLVELRKASEEGACLVLLEQTGLGQVTPSPELCAIGERIWELMPERYTRNPSSGAVVGSFTEAFAQRATPPRNQLLRRLREGFELELCAQFGFLAEAFVSGPIAGCFDAGNPRDQRFLKQIADVDERRLESGSAAALHLIARIDLTAPR